MTEENKTKAAGPDSGAGKKGIPKAFTYAIVIILILVLLAGAYVVINSKSPPTSPGGEVEIPVPGHPELYQKPVEAYFENHSQAYITENKQAHDPVYGQLISFLQDDATEYGVYEPGHSCVSFAMELHDRAELSRIKSHLVVLTLSDISAQHVIVAFNTTDKGMVYVDDTGITQDEIDRSILVADRIATVEVGTLYVRHFLPPFDVDEDPGMGNVERVDFIS